MIVNLNDTSFEYDVRSLLRAFFPHIEVRFLSNHQSSDTLDQQETEDITIFVETGKITVYQNDQVFSSSCEGLDRAGVKNTLKCQLYDCLSVQTEKKLPWGTLTGIRPTKLVLGKVKEGAAEEEIISFMQERYRTSKKKIDLSYEIAKREWKIIRMIPKDSYSLYVGIPFCPSICLYCSFSSYPVKRYQDKIDAYLDALFTELKETSDLFSGRPLSSIYIGGGTPTSLSADQLHRLLERIAEYFDTKQIREWTIEAGRADSITIDKLNAIKDFGDIRISINPQTFHQKTLDLIGRKHTVSDVKKAFAMAREAGFLDINMDLIVGLPGESDQEAALTLEEVKTLSPDNLTVHSLALKRASRLHEEWERYKDNIFHQSSAVMDMVMDAATQMNMHPYYLYRQKDIAGNLENIGFAPSGKEGIYNILMMEDVQDIAACGAGAISKRVTGRKKPERAANIKDVDQYIERIDELITRKQNLFLETGEEGV